ncbi:hypothetical protein ACFYUV_49920 [Nonomuraea sp. NPDC003560]
MSGILETILHGHGSDGRSLHTTCLLCDHRVRVPCTTREAHQAATRP